MQLDLARAIGQLDLVHHRRRRGDQVQIIFAGQPFLDDFQMEEAEEAAAEAEAQRRAAFHFEAEAGIVQAQLADAVAQFVEIIGVDREEAAKHHRLHFLEARQRRGCAIFDRGDGVAHAGLGNFLDLRGDEADFACRQFGQLFDLGPHATDAVNQMFGAADHELDRLPLPDHAIDDADQDDDAQIGVVPAVDQHRLQRRVAVALWRRDFLDDGFQNFVDADARFGAGQHRFGRIQADDILDFLAHLFRFRGGQVDLVEHRHDLMIMLDRLVNIGQSLRFHALRRVHDQQRALARGKGTADLIGEVDMARRVHQVQLIGLAVFRDIVQAHRLRLDRDPALLLNVHVIKDLGAHLAVRQAAGPLDQPVRQRGLAMVDMGDDRKVTDVAKLSHCAPIAGVIGPVSRIAKAPSDKMTMAVTPTPLRLEA